MENDLIKYILEGNFDKASHFDESETEIVIKKICDESYEYQNLTFYCFTIFMYSKTNNYDWLDAAVSILCFSINWMEGAYAMALYHQREILKHSRNLNNLQMMLFFYRLPDVDFSEEEAIAISREILLLDPKNEIVKSIFPKLL